MAIQIMSRMHVYVGTSDIIIHTVRAYACVCVSVRAPRDVTRTRGWEGVGVIVYVLYVRG